MTQSRTLRGLDTLERARFFPRQVILPVDLAQDQLYFLHKLRRHNRLFHGFGIAYGLTAEPLTKKAAEDLCKATVLPSGINWEQWLVIRPGFALAPPGDEIYL